MKKKTRTTKKRPSPKSKPRVAIVHDWLVGGGAEKVVLELHKMFPEAPIYTSYASKEWQEKLGGKVITGYLQNKPFSKLRKYLPILRMRWFSRLKLQDYDIVISSSGNGEAKHVLPDKNLFKKPLHINYCHSPVHFYWRHHSAYMKNPGFGVFNMLARAGLKLLVGPLRKADYEAAQTVDFFIANSTHIKRDIKQYYDHDSTVVHPPVDTKAFSRYSTKNKKGFVTVGRLVPNKRVDLIVKACTELGEKLVVVGRGPELENLKAIAGPSVKFDTNATDNQVAKYMRGAKAFLFASHEDFGITPVEALASGTPVIAYKAGGALDYVEPNKTGIFFGKQTPESLASAIKRFNKLKPNTFKQKTLKKKASEFSANNFRKSFKKQFSKALEVL